ncbi:MAG: hypothetical protein ACYTGV_16220, partial [Planctomycetota bacterium]
MIPLTACMKWNRRAAHLAILVLLVGCGPSTPGSFQLDQAPVLPAGPPLMVMACVGDTHGKNQLEEFGIADPLAGVTHLFGSQDLFLFNHEGVLVDSLPPDLSSPLSQDLQDRGEGVSQRRHPLLRISDPL